jgi:hypothetical protein
LTYKDYELLIAKIIEKMGQVQGISNSKVLHDAMVEGLSGAKYQIDVLWEFQIGPLKYRTLFEAKNWKNRVDLSVLKEMNGVLRDIADAKGVVVTCSGYDKGNIDKVANSFGIRLLVLDETGDLINQNCLPIDSATVSVHPINIRIVGIKFKTAEQVAAFNSYQASTNKDTITFYDRNNVHVTMKFIIDQIYQKASSENLTKDGQHLTFRPAGPLFVQCPEIEVELEEIHAKVRRGPVELLGKANLKITHLLRTATGDETYYIDDTFKIHKSDDYSFDLNYRDPTDSAKMLTTEFSFKDRRKNGQ